MNVLSKLNVSKAEFYRFVSQQAEGRFEYEDGRIVQQMTGGTFDHMRLVQRFVALFERQLDLDKWVVTSQGRGVETGRTIRYPDVVVERSGGAAKALSTTTPSLLAEVLSSTTEDLDLNVKPPEYLALGSLAAYIVASQDEPMCLIWRRGKAGRFAKAPLQVRGLAGTVELPALGLTIALGEVYRGILG